MPAKRKGGDKFYRVLLPVRVQLKLAAYIAQGIADGMLHPNTTFGDAICRLIEGACDRGLPFETLEALEAEVKRLERSYQRDAPWRDN